MRAVGIGLSRASVCNADDDLKGITLTVYHIYIQIVTYFIGFCRYIDYRRVVQFEITAFYLSSFNEI